MDDSRRLALEATWARFDAELRASVGRGEWLRSTGQLRALLAVRQHAGLFEGWRFTLSNRQLAEMLGVSQTAAWRYFDRLVKRGWLYRVPNAQRRRPRRRFDDGNADEYRLSWPAWWEENEAAISGDGPAPLGAEVEVCSKLQVQQSGPPAHAHGVDEAGEWIIRPCPLAH